MQRQIFNLLSIQSISILSGLFLALFPVSESVGQVLINELDPSVQGIDNREFIELVGAPNEEMSGFVVVVFNGANNESNLTIDLSGYALNESGFFLIGGSELDGADLTIIQSNWLQVGQDAVAIF
ncbi:MAG TPA: hypothetical protein DCF87_07835, partial [Opitutae bacterium]|nr:hypothetical protein [Opitutae bacterium]